MGESLQANFNYLLTVLGLVAFCVGSVAVGWVVWKVKGDEAWRKTAESRMARITDLTDELNREKARRARAEDESEKFEARWARAQAKVDWYEVHHGPVPPGEL
jgi:hypothetical protein